MLPEVDKRFCFPCRVWLKTCRCAQNDEYKALHPTLFIRNSQRAMTTEQENKIIQQAQDIMARRYAVGSELKLNAQSVAYYGAYYLGAIKAVQEVTQQLLDGDKPKGEDWVYLEAFWQFITKNKRNMQMFMDGEEMRYRNHQRDQKGKLKSVECYFVERRTLITEKI